MVIHVCDKCHKKFNRKDNYVRHLSRKIPCQKVEFEGAHNKGATNCTKKSAICTKKSAKNSEKKKKNDKQLKCKYCKKQNPNTKPKTSLPQQYDVADDFWTKIQFWCF